MKKIAILIIVALFAGVGSFAQVAWAEDDDNIAVSADVSFANKYVWRGIVLTEGFVMQPSMNVAVGALTFNAWANMDLEDINDNEFEFNEVDLTADYAFETEMLAFNAGVIYYTFPNTDFDSTLEVYFGATLNTFLSPNVTLYKDVDLVEGLYASFGVGQDVPAGKDSDMSVSLAATLGWGDESHNLFYYGVDEASFTDVLISASTSYPLTDKLSFGASTALTILLSDDIQANFDRSFNFVGALGLSYSF